MTWAHEPPLDPDGAQGRRLLKNELDKVPYQEQKSLLERFLDRIEGLLEPMTGPSSGGWSKVILFILVALLVALIVYAVTRVTASRRVKAGRSVSDAVFDEPNQSAEDYRARARTAESRGDYSAALLDWFRALARSADERALLGNSPGRTAHEIVTDLGPYFPDEAIALRHGGDSFDEVRYGGVRAQADRCATMRELDARIAKARPQHDTEAVGSAELVAPGRWAK